MLPLTTITCGELPNDGALREVLSHLGQSLDSILSRAAELQASANELDHVTFGPYLARAALEVGMTAITARFDPYRILAIRKSQLSASYDIRIRNPIAFNWANDVQGADACKKWDDISTIQALQRALLSTHFHDLFWEEAFLSMLDATGDMPAGNWMT